VRLILDEMYPGVIAEMLRSRGYDVVSVHDPAYRHLEGASDEELFSAALKEERALVTENVPDFRRLEAEALGRGKPHPALVFTTNRQFPRGIPGMTGRLVEALAVPLLERQSLRGSLFLRRARADKDVEQE
jgi:predicted nuclease of predicted toxin-antitoxin system